MTRRCHSDTVKASYRAAWLSALFLPTVQIVAAVALGAIVWYGGVQIQLGFITIGGIQAFSIKVRAARMEAL